MQRRASERRNVAGATAPAAIRHPRCACGAGVPVEALAVCRPVSGLVDD